MLAPNDISALNLALTAAVDEREKREKFWRKYRQELIGPRWREGLGVKRSTNQVAIYTQTMRDVLAFQSGKANLKPKIPGLGGPIAEVYELGLQFNMSETKWLEQLRLIVVDSFYAVGVSKSVLMPSGNSSDAGFRMGDDGPLDPLMPGSVRVSPFDFLWDDTARHWRECSFFAHEFDRDLELILGDPRYDLEGIDVSAIPTSHTNMDRDERAGDRWREEFHKKMPMLVRLVEIWLRDSNMMVTLLRMSPKVWLPIRAYEYWGPEDGPYHLLGYTWVPDAVMPLAPGQSWWEQWIELERQEWDLLTQIRNEKTVVAFPSGAGDSAKIIDEAKKHSFITGIDNIGQQQTYGGATAQKITAVLEVRSAFERASGLSDILRGVQGTNKDETATAVTIRDRHTNIRLDAMQNALLDFSEETLRDRLWYMWYDPAVIQEIGLPSDTTGQEPLIVTAQGGAFTDPMTGLPDMTLDLPDFYLEIVRDSFMRRSGPLERLQAIEEAQLVLGPLLQIGMMQGFMLDFPAYLNDLGDKIGNDMLGRLFIPMTPLAAQLMMMGQQAGMAGALGAQSVGTIEADTPASPGGQASQGAGQVAAPLGVAQRPPGGQSTRNPGKAK